MKVLLISHYPPPAGGIASWTKRILEIGLPNNWEIVHINSNMIGGRDPFKNTKLSLRDEYVRSTSIWKKEIQAFKDREIQIVHTCIPCTLFGMLRECVTGLIAKLSSKKFILHCRCTVPNVVNTPLKRMVFKVLSSLCDGIITLNQKSQDFVEHNSKAKSRLIPNFVSLEELNSSIKEVRPKIQEVVYIGGVTPEKGCDIIIQAAKELPNIKFNLVGNVSKDIADMKKPNNVVLHGNQDKKYLQNILANSDVFLFLSRFWGEGFSNALVEAMGAGLPCIVSDWAANADMIKDEGGIVIEGKSPQALVAALKTLDTDQSRRMKMSERNIDTAFSCYSESVILRAYVDFYSELLITGDTV